MNAHHHHITCPTPPHNPIDPKPPNTQTHTHIRHAHTHDTHTLKTKNTHSPAYLVDGATDTPVSAAAAKAAASEQQGQQQHQMIGEILGEMACPNGGKAGASKTSPTPPQVPTPKHAPLPPTLDSLPANSLLTIDRNSQPILVIPPPPTIKKTRQTRWMRIEKQ
jgi:hypothetical protein